MKQRKRKTTDEFIAQCKAVHGDTYHYHNTTYTGSKDMVTVTCTTHGDFDIEANSHLKGNGCKACTCSRYEPYEVKARKVHGNKYDYAITAYSGKESTILVRCPKHDVFRINAYSHLKGRGCRKCAKEEGTHKKAGSKGRTLQEHVEEANRVHDSRYDYSKIVFTTVMDDVEIICPVHDSFWQSLASHKRGRGCPECAETGFSRSKDGTFYMLTISDETRSFLGYGISNTFPQRLSQHKTNIKKHGFSIQEITYFEMTGQEAFDLEKRIKSTFALFPNEIEGFITEATDTCNHNRMLKEVQEFLLETQQ